MKRKLCRYKPTNYGVLGSSELLYGYTDVTVDSQIWHKIALFSEH